MRAIEVYSHARGITLGKAASELVRRGARFQLGSHIVNGLPVLDVPEDFPVITTEFIRDLTEEE